MFKVITPLFHKAKDPLEGLLFHQNIQFVLETVSSAHS